MVDRAKQGHIYQHGDSRVLALESGSCVRVAELLVDRPWLGREYQALAQWLTPLPMRYFHGQAPR